LVIPCSSDQRVDSPTVGSSGAECEGTEAAVVESGGFETTPIKEAQGKTQAAEMSQFGFEEVRSALASGLRDVEPNPDRERSMYRYSVYALSLFALTISACQSQGGSASLDTEDQKASYAIGLQTGVQLAPAEGHLDADAYMAGVRDGMAGNDPAVPPEELQTALQALNTKVQEGETQRRAAEAEANVAEAEAFLAENAQKEGVNVTESGLHYEVLRPGDGPRPTTSDRVRIHYRGTLLDGTEFDTSYGGEPASFGVTGVITGFSEGLQLMEVGSQYRFVIPGELGYGMAGSGPQIGAMAALVFEVELLEIVQ
jgi:FKBP-type peptidyl-prolyl cis-trans isomerase